MIKSIIIFVLVFLFNSSVKTYSQEIEWQNAIGGNSTDYFRSISQTADKGYICGGFSFSPISGDKTENTNGGYSDYWILKLDSIGMIQWQNTIGGSNNDELSVVLQTSDGGYFCAGNSRSDASGDKTEDNIGLDNYWVLKLDASGNILWDNTIGGNSMDLLRAAVSTDDGGFILGGTSSSNISGDKTENGFGSGDYWIVKLNFSGNIVWQKTIGGSDFDYLYSLSITSDGGVVCGGVSNSDSSGNKTENNIGANDYWVVKLDSLGNIEWQNTIGGTDNDYMTSVSQTKDGGYICGGYSISGIGGDKKEMNYGGYDYWVMKLDSFGNIVWQNSIGGNLADELTSISPNIDGGFICGGSSESGISFDKKENSQGNKDYWIVKLDSVGHMQWQNTIGGSFNDVLNSLQPTIDEGFICGGSSLSGMTGDKTENSNGTNDYWVVKITSKFNFIEGHLYEDLNLNNAHDPNELLIPNRKVEELTNGQFAFTDQNGFYSILMLDTGNFMVSPFMNNNYYNLSPPTRNGTFSNFLEIDSLNDFAFQPSTNINDLCIRITPSSPFRSGMDATYKIVFSNEGTTVVNPTVVFYPDNDLTFVSSSPVASQIYPDSMIWNIGSLSPFNSSSIFITVHVNPGLFNPTLINSGVSIKPIIGDPTPQCNLSYWELMTTGSHDPNEIQVNRDTLFDYEIASPPFLEYLIQFQNTGNDTAFYVELDNTIRDELDLTSFEVVDVSHPYRIEYLNYDSTLKFIFQNILLPDSNVNELNSHGFVRYKIKPKSSLSVGDSILNDVNIIFDYNPPVQTNLVTTHIVTPVGLNEFIPKTEILFYPNPASDQIMIEMNLQKTQFTIIEIYNSFGQKIKNLHEGNINSGKWNHKYDLSDLSNGVYLIRVQSEKSITHQIIKF